MLRHSVDGIGLRGENVFGFVDFREVNRTFHLRFVGVAKWKAGLDDTKGGVVSAGRELFHATERGFDFAMHEFYAKMHEMEAFARDFRARFRDFHVAKRQNHAFAGDFHASLHGFHERTRLFHEMPGEFHMLTDGFHESFRFFANFPETTLRNGGSRHVHFFCQRQKKQLK